MKSILRTEERMLGAVAFGCYCLALAGGGATAWALASLAARLGPGWGGALTAAML